MLNPTNLYTVKAVSQNDNDIDDIVFLLEELDKKNKKNFTDTKKSIEGAISRAEEINNSLDQSFPFFDSSIVATDIAYALAVLYESVYKICEIFDADKTGTPSAHLPEKIEYRDIRELRNIIGVRYASPGLFIKEDIQVLLEFVKAILNECQNNITLDDCININNIINLIAGNITKLLLGTKDKSQYAGKDYVLEIAKNEATANAYEAPAPEAPAADFTAAASEPAKENKFSFDALEPEKEEKEEPVEAPAPKAEYTGNSDAEKLLAEIYGDIENLKKTMATRDSIRATLNISVPQTGLSGESKSIVDDILKNINSTIDTHLKPLNDKVDEEKSGIEAKFDALFSELEKLRASVKEF